MKNILVVGGTGTLGRELVHRLLKSNKNVTVLTRHPGKAAALEAAGARLLKGDLLDKSSLQAACHGMDAVVSAAHGMLGKGRYASENVDGTGQKHLIDAAHDGGVRYFVLVSVIGAAPDHPIDFWRNKWEAEEYLRQSGLAYNIIRASAFMEVHIGELMGKSILEKGRVTIFGKGENPANFVSVRDVAYAIERCVDHSDLHDRTFDIGGPDNLTRHEIVALYAQKLGKPVKTSHVPNVVLRGMSALIKPFHPGLSRIMYLSDYIDRTDQRFNTEPPPDLCPPKRTRVSDFVRGA